MDFGDSSELFDAVTAGDTARVQAELDTNKCKPAEKNGALYLATTRGQQAMMEYLLVALRPDADTLGSALCVAAERGRPECLAVLIAAGADVHIASEYALGRAAALGRPVIAKLLLDAGADANANGGGILWLAVRGGYPDVVRLLREKGALFVPRMLEDISTFKPAVQIALLGAGDVSGVSAVDLARQGICLEALYALLDHQGNPTVAAILQSTQTLDNLTPAARAELLDDLLAQTQTQSPCYA